MNNGELAASERIGTKKTVHTGKGKAILILN